MTTTELCERERLALSRGRGSALPARRVVASWKRSAQYGVPLDAVLAAFSGTVDDDSLFYESGHEILTDLHQSLADEPIGLMLTDTAGLVLDRMCSDRRLLDALDAVSLAPGFDYSERRAGTTGLGLALADRAPTLVRADQHYCTRLWGYTCAAVPVADPVTGELLGAVNLTTWSQRSHTLLLALARTAARATEALMLARDHGRPARAPARGRVVPVSALRDRDAPHDGPHDGEELGPEWRAAAAAVASGLDGGVAVVGEPGVGKAALLREGHGRRPGRRVLHVRPPDPEGVESWLALFSPELAKPGTAVIVGRVDELPAWAADELTVLLTAAPDCPVSVTARDASAVPAGLRALVGTVVELPALRHRPGDVMPLARRLARAARGREVHFDAAAEQVLTTHPWPGNVAQLRGIVRDVVTRTDRVTAPDLPPEVRTGAHHRLTRLEALERDEIVRSLAAPGATPARAAAALGMSRSTIYRRIARYGIRPPTEAAP